jgi:DNA-binding transcriptional regulator YdaS (Cro superfamily)
METFAPIEKAVAFVGRATKLASILGVSSTTVHEWRTGKRKVPAARCKDICEITNGQVSVMDLRPTDWHKYWPEMAQPHANAIQPATETVANQGA